MSDTITAEEVRRRLPTFLQFLAVNGASVGSPTSEWELVRFMGDNKLSIIYRNKIDQLTFTGRAYPAWKAFRSGTGIDLQNFRKRRRRVDGMVPILLERDGPQCFFCLEPITSGEETVEHVLSIDSGGGNHIANLVLSHELCNSKAGNKSVLEKVRIRERNIIKKLFNSRRLGAHHERAEEGYPATRAAGTKGTAIECGGGVPRR